MDFGILEASGNQIPVDNKRQLYLLLQGFDRVKLEHANTFHSHQPRPEGVSGMKRRRTVVREEYELLNLETE